MKKIVSVLISLIFIITALASISINASASELETSYNSNPANIQYMTPVKNQGTYGNCWAFAAIACCEADAIKNHGANKDDIDLSEYHLAYFSYNGERSTGDTVTAAHPFYEFGGFSHLPILSLSGWIGLVDESVAKYSDFTKNPDAKLNTEIMYGNNEYYLTNAYVYSLPNDINKVKEAIRTYGAVQTSYCSSVSQALNTTTYAQYCATAYESDHSVTIVGWDDNYSRTNFNSSQRPANNGAWLVKNSWGSSWGNLGGYFWLSYEDKTAVEAIAFDVIPSKDAYDNNYQHDGGISNSYMADDRLTMANIFTATGNQELSAVGITTYETTNSYYSLEIYINPTSLTPNDFNSGSPVYTQSGTILQSGFTTIPLNSPITLSEGDTFIILIETDANLCIDSDQEIKSDSTTLASSDAYVLENQTYVSSRGNAFVDASDTIYVNNPFNARIKAFTKNLTLGIAEFKHLPNVSTIKYGQPLKEATLSGGEVVDSLSQKKIEGKWEFKDPNAIAENGETVKIIFTPVNSGYSTIEREITVSIAADKPIITISTNKSSYRDGEKVTVTATVKNAHSSSLSDLPKVKLFYRINDGAKVYFTDSFNFPTALSDIKLTIGAETVSVSNKYESAEKTRIFTIKAPENTQIGDQTNGGTQNGNNTQNNDTVQEDTISNEESTSKSKIETTQNDKNVISFNEIKDLQDEFGGTVVTTNKGCFSSASISALTVACTIFGAALLKKKKDN